MPYCSIHEYVVPQVCCLYTFGCTVWRLVTTMISTGPASQTPQQLQGPRGVSGHQG
jgi:hypothetical protein